MRRAASSQIGSSCFVEVFKFRFIVVMVTMYATSRYVTLTLCYADANVGIITVIVRLLLKLLLSP